MFRSNILVFLEGSRKGDRLKGIELFISFVLGIRFFRGKSVIVRFVF